VTYLCDDCGLDLTLEPWQIQWVIEHGNPVPRPPCPVNEDGAHRVGDGQLAAVSSAQPGEEQA
jgi:hypothetical protein